MSDEEQLAKVSAAIVAQMPGLAASGVIDAASQWCGGRQVPAAAT
jgi:hypothetical protein